MTSTSNDVHQLANLFQEATKQRWFLQTRIEDKKLQDDGWHLYFAVDTDITTFFADPTTKAAASEDRKEGYAQIFPGDKCSFCISLGRFLADFIFENLDPLHPRLIIPPLEDEFRRVVNAKIRDADTEQYKAKEELKNLHRKLKELKENNKSGQDLLKQLDRLAPSLHTILSGGSGPTIQLARIGQLLNNHRIAPLDFALGIGELIDNTALSEVCEKIEALRTTKQFRGLRDSWFHRLKSVTSEKQVSVLTYDDATVLTILEEINCLLVKEKCRILYITGDSSLFHAAQGYTPKNGNATFAALYLRHPRSYLMEPEILFPGDYSPEERNQQQSSFLHWLETFLAYQDGNDQQHQPILAKDPDNKALIATATSVLHRHPRILDEFQQTWEEYSKDVAFAHGPGTIPGSSGKNDPFRDLRAASLTLEELLSTLEKKLSERVMETWNTLFVTVSEAGWWLQKHRNVANHILPRNIPVLLFNNFPRSREIADNFMEKLLATNERKPHVANNYLRILDDLKGKDPSYYTVFLVFALLFGAEGNWHIAEVLSRQALNIGINHQGVTLTGREAAFLQAVATRYNARTITFLEKVDGLLDQAFALLAKGQESDPSITGGVIRFEAERLALELTRHHFRLFLGKQSEKVMLSPLSDLEERITLFLDNKEKFDAEPDQKIKKTIEQNLLTYLFMIVFLRLDKEGTDLNSDNYQGYLDRFRNNMEASEKEPKVIRSFLTQSIFMVAEWWLEKDPDAKATKQRNVSDFITDTEIEKKSVFLYDRDRFEFLRDLVKKGSVYK
ncbi:MAG: hypothetical protein H7829_08565 [Magnetococcus sp. THC-1_WYH]